MRWEGECFHNSALFVGNWLVSNLYHVPEPLLFVGKTGSKRDRVRFPYISIGRSVRWETGLSVILTSAQMLDLGTNLHRLSYFVKNSNNKNRLVYSVFAWYWCSQVIKFLPFGIRILFLCKKFLLFGDTIMAVVKTLSRGRGCDNHFFKGVFQLKFDCLYMGANCAM